MYVLLRSCGNPAYEQNPFENLYGVPTQWKPAESFEEAAKICREFIEKYNLGSGNWYGGYIFESLDVKKQKQLAYISYNGRIWTKPEDMVMYIK